LIKKFKRLILLEEQESLGDSCC